MHRTSDAHATTTVVGTK